MPFRDSIDKIVGVYFGVVAKRPFSYKGVRYVPRSFAISPLVFRGFTCPPLCGGCCPRFTLDYLPTDIAPESVVPRDVLIDDRIVAVKSDFQNDHSSHHCRNLSLNDGRCSIYAMRPFSCDFELIRFIERSDVPYITQKLFGRGWAMLRVDGRRGARCEMTPASENTVQDVVRKIERLHQWSEHFGMQTWIPEILTWLRSGPHKSALRISIDQ